MEKKLLLLVLGILLVPTIFASLSYPPDAIADIKVSCFDIQNDLCADSVNCNITAVYPNGTLFIDEQEMSYNANYFNYTTPSELKTKGEYNAVVSCESGTTYGYITFSFYVTNYPVISGSSNQGLVAIGILASSLFISIIFMTMGFKFSNKPIAVFFILMSCIFIVIAVQQGYTYSSDILVSESASGFQFTLYIGLFYGLLAMAFLGLVILIVKTIGEFKERKSLIDYGEGYNTKTGQYE